MVIRWLCAAIGSLAYGRRSGASRLSGIRTPIIFFVIAIPALVLVSASICFAVDPLNYFQGRHPVAQQENYAPAELPKYIPAIVKQPDIRGVLMGGSGSYAFSNPALTSSFGAPMVNVSYSGPRTVDYVELMDYIARASHINYAMAVVFDNMIDASITFDKRYIFPYAYLNGDYVGLFDFFALKAWPDVMRLWENGGMIVPPDEEDYRRSIDRIMTVSSADQERRKAAFFTHFQKTFSFVEPSEKCSGPASSYDPRLARAIQRFSATGKRLDVVLHPYALFYFRRYDGSRAARYINTSLCLIHAVAGLPNVRVFWFAGWKKWVFNNAVYGFDFNDGAHWYSDEMAHEILQSIKTGQFQVNSSTSADFARTFTAELKSYEPRLKQ